MRHRRKGKKLGRTASHRKAMMRNLVTEFLDKERIITTISKAKELRPVAEKMITLGKRENLHARRRALSFIRRKSVVSQTLRRNRPPVLRAQRRLHSHSPPRISPGRSG